MTYPLNMAAVVDHILTLQQSLAHYERMLSESHPMYLQNLYIDLLRGRSKGDFALIILGVAGMMHLPPLVLSGTYDV
jgi:magnesium transporter